MFDPISRLHPTQHDAGPRETDTTVTVNGQRVDIAEAVCDRSLVGPLLRLFRQDPTLRSLTLGVSALEDMDALGLCAALRCNRCLTELDLSGIEISQKFAMGLFSVFAIQCPGDSDSTNQEFLQEQMGELNELESQDDLPDGAKDVISAWMEQIAETVATDPHGKPTDLASNQSILTLKLNGCQLDDTNALIVCMALAGNDTLVTLRLADNQITDQGAEYLSQIMQLNTRLTELDLRDNADIGYGAKIALADLLARNRGRPFIYREMLASRVQSHVAQRQPQIGIRAIELAREAWEEGSVLGKELEALLHYARAKLAQAQVLAEAGRSSWRSGDCASARAAWALSLALCKSPEVLEDLKKTKTLPPQPTWLSTLFNRKPASVPGETHSFMDQLAGLIEDDGSLTRMASGKPVAAADVQAIAAALRHNTHLTELDLSNSEIDNSGADYLATLLYCNIDLRTIKLAGNRIGNTGAKALAAALKCNRRLVLLDLDGNPIDDQQSSAEITASLERNRLLARNHARIMMDYAAALAAAGHSEQARLLTLRAQALETAPENLAMLRTLRHRYEDNVAESGWLQRQALAQLEKGQTLLANELIAMAKTLCADHPDMRDSRHAFQSAETVDFGDSPLRVSHPAEAPFPSHPKLWLPYTRLKQADPALTRLRLDGLNLSDEEVEMVVAVMRGNKSPVTEIDLSGNRIGHKGVKALATLLPELEMLEVLDLSRNAFDSEALSSLSDIVIAAPPITLRLDGNPLSTRAVYQLVSGLLANSSLAALQLCGCGLDDSKLGILMEGLAGNTHLTSLDVRDNPAISAHAPVRELIAAKLSRNRAVTHLKAEYLNQQAEMWLSGGHFDEAIVSWRMARGLEKSDPVKRQTYMHALELAKQKKADFFTEQVNAAAGRLRQSAVSSQPQGGN
ncbi:hypothetical protein FNU76_20615 [Chitinimonas arctica]|uniref:Uncharacterized protein n=1 Tax=Chitinimonas arctica TaxID=2594795 RepID=A0A516SK80_9NEIS|nr:hypothetical protein [Chitinimonas arctica]QDQ28560.1 hypothetical protein FNU76_20615 [Chitinimonas arctica]